MGEGGVVKETPAPSDAAGEVVERLGPRLRRRRLERGMTLADLAAATATGDPRLHPRPAVRYGMTWLPLTGRPGSIQAHKLVMPPRLGADEPEQRSHQGYEWLYVLAGHLRLRLGTHDLVLAAGEVAEFDTRTPHAFTNPADTPTEVLMLIGPQGQRAHVRARPARRAGTPRT